MDLLPRALFVLGVGFLAANLRLLLSLVRFRRLRGSEVLTWPGRRPPFYRLFLLLGVVLAILVFVKVVLLRLPPTQAFGEMMMLLYYGCLVPLSLRIGRGFYEQGILVEGGFMPYSQIAGLSWREEKELTLVLIPRMRRLAHRLVVPRDSYAQARKLLRDRIAQHDIHFQGHALDLGGHDERDDV